MPAMSSIVSGRRSAISINVRSLKMTYAGALAASAKARRFAFNADNNGASSSDTNVFTAGRRSLSGTSSISCRKWAIVKLDTPMARAAPLSAISQKARQIVARALRGKLGSVLLGGPRFEGANGIEIDGDVLYVGGTRLWRVDLTTASVATIGPEWLTDIDGIEIEPDGTLQITPVAGPLVRFRSEDDLEILGGEGISSANHGFAASLSFALIPTGFDNTVIAIRVSGAGEERP